MAFNFTNPQAPNITDFLAFVIAQGVPAEDIPADSPYLQGAFDQAFYTCINVPCVPNFLYCLAVYNLGMHTLVTIAPDQDEQTFFEAARKKYGILDFVAGVVQATDDNGSGVTLLVADWMKNMPLSTLLELKTPWGAYYNAYAQKAGPTVIGIS